MRLKRTLASEAGLTYVAMIVMVTVMGIMMSQAAISWKFFIQRSKEEELLFRGMQVREALQRYYYGRVINIKTDLKPADTERAKKQPNLEKLDDLLHDPRSQQTKRYLRPFALKDPMTGEEWDVIRDAQQRIIGVKSKSELEPIKTGNFPYQLEPGDFEPRFEQTPVPGAVEMTEQKPSYQNWQFIYDRIPVPKGEAKEGVQVPLPGEQSSPLHASQPGEE